MDLDYMEENGAEAVSRQVACTPSTLEATQGVLKQSLAVLCLFMLINLLGTHAVCVIDDSMCKNVLNCDHNRLPQRHRLATMRACQNAQH